MLQDHHKSLSQRSSEPVGQVMLQNIVTLFFLLQEQSCSVTANNGYDVPKILSIFSKNII